jgi:hypothetical protein
MPKFETPQPILSYLARIKWGKGAQKIDVSSTISKYVAVSCNLMVLTKKMVFYFENCSDCFVRIFFSRDHYVEQFIKRMKGQNNF